MAAALGQAGRGTSEGISQKPLGVGRAPRQTRADLSEEGGGASPAPAAAVGGPPASSLAENPNSLWLPGAWENEGTYQNSMAALLATRGVGPSEAVTNV